MKMCLAPIFLLFAFFLSCNLDAQKVVNVVFPSEGEVTLAKGISVPKIESGYTLWLPSFNNIKGMIVFFHSRREEKKKENIIRIAGKDGLAVMYVTTDNPIEFLFEESKMEEMASYILSACNSFQIPKDRLLYSGVAFSGTRALKMATFVSQEKRYSEIIPAAISVCDSPIDMRRYFNSSQKGVEVNFESEIVDERYWASSYLESNLDGPPAKSQARYIQYSPFSRSVRNGGNTPYLRDIPFRGYTEPDVEWWIENRRKDYYGMNAYDLKGFVNQLILLGSDTAELLPTKNKGKREDGSKQPHSWSLSDEKEMVQWFMKIIKD